MVNTVAVAVVGVWRFKLGWMAASASTRLAAQTLPTTAVAEVKQAKIVTTSSTATTVAEAK